MTGRKWPIEPVKISSRERISMDTIQRQCVRCGGWFYVESCFDRQLRDMNNSYAAKGGGGFFMRGPSVGRRCPDCRERKHDRQVS